MTFPSAALEAALDEALADRALDPTTWAARAVLGECVGPGRRWRPPAEVGAHLASPLRGQRGLDFAFGEGVLLASDTSNQRRTLSGIADALSARPVAVAGRRRDVARRVRSLRPVLGTWRTILDAAGRAQVPTDDGELLHRLLGAERSLDRARAVLEQTTPQVVVVASTATPAVRGLLLLARAAGVPSTYLPHAPVSRRRTYLDLPVDLALLRGEAERDWYRDHGVVDGIAVVGDPTPTTPPPPPAGSVAPFVLVATSPHPTELLRAELALVARGLGDLAISVVVAPHPRQRTEDLARHVPRHWRVLTPGSTQGALAEQPRCVVQCSSGVALDALRRGIPTVDLALPDEPPLYPFLQDPHVTLVRSEEQLRHTVADAATWEDSDLRRDGLRAWATAWVLQGPPQAVESSLEEIASLVRRGPREAPVADAWFGSASPGLP